MRKLTGLFYSLICFACLISCNSPQGGKLGNEEVKEVQIDNDSLPESAFYRVSKGFTVADLILLTDSNYLLLNHANHEDTFVLSGTYVKNKSGIILSAVDTYLFSGGKKNILKRDKGEQVILRNEFKGNDRSPILKLQGSYLYYADAMNFRVCGKGHSYEIKKNSEALNLERTYLNSGLAYPERLEIGLRMKFIENMGSEGKELKVEVIEVIDTTESWECP